MIASLKKNTDWLAIASTVVFFILVLMSPSVKIYFLVSLLWFLFLSFFYSFPKALVYTVPLLMSFNAGQEYSFQVIGPNDLKSVQYWNGKHLFFVLSPHMFICLVGLVLLPFFYKQSKFKLFFHETIFIFMFLSFLFSSLWFSQIPFLSLLFYFKESVVVVWLIYIFLFSKKNKSEKEKIVFTFIILLTINLLFESGLVTIQLLRNSTIGLVIEKTQLIPVFGLGADEGGGFRPFGWYPHANSLANNQLIFTFAILFLSTYLKNNFFNKLKKFLLPAVIFMGLFSSFVALSRSAILAIFLAVLIFVIVGFKKDEFYSFLSLSNRNIKKLSPIFKLLILLVGSFLILKMVGRMVNSSFIFSPSGGLYTRTEQFSEALEVVKNVPFFGVGVGMFIPASFSYFPLGQMRYFPEDVHNGFLLFLVERGFVGLLLLVLFLFLLFKELVNLFKNKKTRAVIYSGLMAGFIIMLFHPFINIFSFSVLFLLVIIHYEKETI